VLHSKAAIEISIHIIDSFVAMRRFIQHNANVFDRIDSMERRQIAFESETEKNFEKIFRALETEKPPKQGIFYDGQVYDAYAFVSDLIRGAKHSLILIDNFVNDSVLTLLSKRKNSVKATVYTKHISKRLSLDLKKHNEQYPPVRLEIFKKAHDRFLIIDEKEIYHLGASLKDLGKKWFAFSRFDSEALEMFKRLGGNK
ncbi:MAG: ORF6N domain-containing protein, partial [Salinispira sp.]